VDTAGEAVVRNSHNSHKGNRAVMRLRSRRRRRLRPRPPLRPKTDRAPSLPATHSPGSTLPLLPRRRLPPRPERSESVSCHHPELTAQAIPHYRLHLMNPPAGVQFLDRPGRREAAGGHRTISAADTGRQLAFAILNLASGASPARSCKNAEM